MKIKSLILALLVSTNVLAYDVTIKSPRVIDGDTIDTGIIVYGLPSLKLRIQGIDTPELRGKCDKEKVLAKEAKLFLSETVKNQDVDFHFNEWDKYGSRIVGVPYLHDVPLNEEMIRRGFAVKYDGGKKIKDWCK